MTWDQRPKDYWGDAWPDPSGGGFYGVFRLPWRSETLLLKGASRKPVSFPKREDALQAVMNHLCNLMCPHLTAGGPEANEKAREQAEALFAKGGTIGSFH